MSSTYRSAMGKPVDMASIRAKNENVRAVGNMGVNSRGDTIDSNNNVVSETSTRVNRVYSKTTVNPTAQSKPPAAPSSPFQVPTRVVAPPSPVIEEDDLSPDEAELFRDLDDEEEIIKDLPKSKKK